MAAEDCPLLTEFLERKLHFTKTRVKQILAKREVTVDGVICRDRTMRLRDGMVVTFRDNPPMVVNSRADLERKRQEEFARRERDRLEQERLVRERLAAEELRRRTHLTRRERAAEEERERTRKKEEAEAAKVAAKAAAAEARRQTHATEELLKEWNFGDLRDPYGTTRNEAVICDCRLEFAELLRLDGPVEVSGRFAYPMEDEVLEHMTWVADADGFMKIPGRPDIRDVEASAIAISSDWWRGLRYKVDTEVRPLLDYEAFISGVFRVFMLPFPAEQSVRVMVVTESRRIDTVLSVADAESKVLRFFSYLYLLPMEGEWPATRAVRHRSTRGAAEADAADGLTTPSHGFGTRVAFAPPPPSAPPPSIAAAHTPFEETPSFPPPAYSVTDPLLTGARAAAPATPPRPAAPPAAAGKGKVQLTVDVDLRDDGPPDIDINATPRALARIKAAWAEEQKAAGPHYNPDMDAGFGTPETPRGLVLFPHQRRTVEWMMQQETLAAGRLVEVMHVKKFHKFRVDCFGIAPAGTDSEKTKFALPSGGIVGHPVGSGKTVIAAALLGRTRNIGPTLTIVPDHIVLQWRSELARFVPDLPVAVADVGAVVMPSSAASVVLAPHSIMRTASVRAAIAEFEWHRLIIDEPQELVKQQYYDEVVRLRAKHRWLLTATPTPLREMMELNVGREFPDPKAFARVRAPVVRACCVRDAPSDCLPVPPLHTHMIPVTLKWQEMTVVHLHAMRAHLQATIRLCSYFAEVDTDGQVTEASEGTRADVASYPSLDQWVKQHRGNLEGALAVVLPKFDKVTAEIDAQRPKEIVYERVEKDPAVRAAEEAAWAAEEAERAARKKERNRQRNAARAEKRAADKIAAAAGPKPADGAPAGPAAAGPAAAGDAAGDGGDGEGDEREPGPAPAAEEVSNKYIDTARRALVRAQREQARQAAMLFQRKEVALSEEDKAVLEANRGIDPELLAQRDNLERRLVELRHLLTFLDTVEATLRDPDTECSVCLTELQGQVVTILPCFHAFCAPCVVKMYGATENAPCPLCRLETPRRALCTFVCSTGEEEIEAPVPKAEKKEKEPDFRGSKIEALVKAIKDVLRTTPDEKILVFAQWDRLVTQIAGALGEHGIAHSILEGRMDERADILATFRTEAAPRVLLLSYENHASGVNLDVANHVFIVHPYCPSYAASSSVVPLELAQAFEKQAIGRVHRYPQRRDVHVYRLYTRGTIEEELYQAWGWA